MWISFDLKEVEERASEEKEHRSLQIVFAISLIGAKWTIIYQEVKQ